MPPTKTNDKKTIIYATVDSLTKVQRDLLALARTHGDKILKKADRFEIIEKPTSDAKTSTLTMLPVLGCLKAAEDFLNGEAGWEKSGRVIDWTTSNNTQREFMALFWDHMPVVDQLGENLKRKADRDYEVINKWLKDNKFDIQLTVPADNNTSNVFAVASILDVLVEWLELGEKTSLRSVITGNSFDAVELKRAQGVVGFLDEAIHPHNVVRLTTKSGDFVFMTCIDSLPKNTFAIADKIRSLEEVFKMPDQVDGVVFPMVDYNSQVDISWICGMTTGKSLDDFKIEQALQQTKFRMNERGARAQSAVAMGFRCRSVAPVRHTVYMDRPFLLWIERQGIKVPLFAGVFAEDVWKEPKEL